jgi:hypothetical protein
MKELIRHSLSLCTYSATRAYEARKDINRLLSHNGLAAQNIPPPIFFDDFPSSEEEVPLHVSSEDDEPLNTKLQKMKTNTKDTPRGIRKGIKGVVGRGKRPPSVKMKTLAPRTLVRSGVSEAAQVQMLLFLSSSLSFLLTC